MVAAIIVFPVLAAYAVLWLGGAVEILTYQDATPGSSCAIVRNMTSPSEADVGREVDRWIGGGLLWRPGVVCVPRPAPRASVSADERAQLAEPEEWSPPYEDRRLSQADVLSLIFAALVFTAVAAGVEARFRRSE
jgi:hypothetical protein